MKKLTPMMKQYFDIKQNYKDCILFFRLGDFYEMFFDDAIIASRVLEITLTSRECGLDEKAPMCGVPYHSSSSYISTLVQNGYKVAICEQTEDAQKSKGLVKREVVRVITPGTIMEDVTLNNNDSNYLMSIFSDGISVGISYVDISIGDIFCTSVQNSTLKEEISKIKPKEIIYNCESLKFDLQVVCNQNNIFLNNNSSEFFCGKNDIMYKYFDRSYLENLNILNNLSIKSSLLGLLEYIYSTQKQITSNINNINYYNSSDFMFLDTFTRKNLELTETIRNKEKKGSLIYVLDKTNTAMGARLLKKYISEPLINKDSIEYRLNLLDELVNEYSLREDLDIELKHVYDIERLCGKIAFGNINPKEMINLKKSIDRIRNIKTIISKYNSINLKTLSSQLDDLSDLYDIIDKSILDDPSANLKDGNIIKESYNDEISQLRNLSRNAINIIKEIESKERIRTGIKSLKIGFNKVFGYYIEITHSNLKQLDIPDYYIRKQTLSNAERFITLELKEIEEKILNADERIKDLEYQLFVDIRNKLYKNINRIQSVAKIIAQIDVFNSLSKVAYENNYCKPQINTLGNLEIIDGRHPVIEKLIKEENFVPNDTIINKDDCNVCIITGPNMAGKSTYMRQVALISLLAHIGSFVPATKANICIMDRIFTRVGASDDLSQGQSTFMVEMDEVSYILKNATKNSLVILDEVGRGTSTYDGISLAWSIVEYIHDNIGCKTLFATHYHELTALENELKRVKNYCVAVEEQGKDIVFLRKIIEGGADKSYGIHVAKLADLPEEIIERANEILIKLEKKESRDINNSMYEVALCKEETENMYKQLDLSHINTMQLIKEISSLDIANMTPIQALNVLYKLNNKAKSMEMI
ncbi:DNA mismatch repair protein MutS [Alkalithermobacter thermoalcaliphilus JW-YL-7 = DSM 7308]|uniref:DNA mismatch repair protein MutS n=1 Tax=Alkalithermobacter thermoalcaliphilus JW-YL-7 = DSM 7308 TaxID=1121328 RepID=A0A150FQF4_CLOPD|nr:DNA mismatch repair protein mutS [[Clostridium] paradoxum JW-YL-7 = DSM 7308]SHK80412.1 DNA mismatch repair protein MutS [[Clostridium] paradoxum JW-YL-7 = DSM 7308]